jgi:PhoPQ-activated pathogenicity-related protein
MAYLTGNCNSIPNRHFHPHTDEDVLVADEIAHNAKTVTIAVKQIPNCPLVYKNDPLQKNRSEDAILA